MEFASGATCRGEREGESTIQKQFTLAKAEISHSQTCGVYDLFLVNEHLDDALGKAIKAIGMERERRRMRTR